ncbi:MAG: hypothetical protein LW875_04930 [Proteobacteria bacterium]|jgi:hypothetical protein|nr:hypothetical protein [Pseudomonadota bacterium]
MGRSFNGATVYLTFLVALSISWSQANAAESGQQVLSIPLGKASDNFKRPAQDLVRDGRLLDIGELTRMARNGEDLSLLNPEENKFWQNKSYSFRENNEVFPASADGVEFLGFDAGDNFTSFSRVKDANGNFFRLGLSRFSQSMMMRAALLRKLGYYVPSPKLYKTLKVSFINTEVMNLFITEAESQTGTDFTDRGWIAEKNTQKSYLILRIATLEKYDQDYFDIMWGLPPNPAFNTSLVQRFSRNRAYRALIVPFKLADVPESINRYSPRMVSINTGYALISYYLAESFSAAESSDLRWILRRLSALTEKDYQQIVQEAQYPPELESLVTAKMIEGARSFFSAFGIANSLSKQNLRISSSSGLVKDGKVTQERAPGYPQRFAHGDRSSPYQDGDLTRYLGVDLRSSVISTAASKLNEKLQLLQSTDYINDLQTKRIQDQIRHVRTNPQSPYDPKVISWGGPIAGFNVNAGRYISTGTYSGSTAPVQLIDTISVSAGIGYFQSLDGFEKYIPTAGANLSYNRDFTHVRPILTIKEGTKEPWKNVLVPRFMSQLSQVLDESTVKGENGIEQKSVDQFLNEMRDGELFTVTDSVALTAYLQTSSGLDRLFGLQPMNFINSITLGADSQRVITRQVSFHRVINGSFNGVHVYIRDLRNKGLGLELNTTYYLNLLKIRAQSTEQDIRSEGFIIDYNPALSAEVTDDTEIGKKLSQVRDNLRISLRNIFKNNDTELLESKFKFQKFNVKHNILGDKISFHFLIWKFEKFHESHLLKIHFPLSEARPDLKPEDSEVTLFRTRKGELFGRDWLTLGFDSLEAWIRNNQKDLSLSRSFGDNPANVPTGRAKWRLITTESDLSKNIETSPSVGIIQHVWGGWSLSKERFFKVVSEITNQFQETGIDGSQLIHPNDFLNMKSLDFYRVTANLSILDSGLEKLRDLLLQPQMTELNPQQSKYALERLVQKWKGKNSSRPRYMNDQELFQQMLSMLGNGDLKKGKSIYEEQCFIERRRKAGSRGSMDIEGKDSFKGNEYHCLTGWMRRLISLAHKYPVENGLVDKKKETQWYTEVLSLLDEVIPTASLLKFLDEKDYVFLVRVNGFRSGDEDGDLEYFSNTLGDPRRNFEEAGGLVNLYIRKTGLMPTELERTSGGFQ